MYQGPCSRLRYCARAGGGDRPFRIPRIVCTVKLTKWRSLAAECALAAVFLAACTAIVVRTIPKAPPPPTPPSPHVASLPADGRARATLRVVTGTLVLTIDPALWRKELAEIREYLGRYGSRLPPVLMAQLTATEQRLG